MIKKSLRITFVLPSEGTAPCGGFKVVYEYANELSRRGHIVTVVHPAFILGNANPVRYVKRTVRMIHRTFDRSFRPDTWFNIRPNVQLVWRPSLHAAFMPDGDVVIATSWRTASPVSGFPASKGRKFYLIQHQEIWDGSEEKVMATWRMPLNKIVIARWLQEIAQGMNEVSTYIPNGLNFQAFGLNDDPAKRSPNRVMMLYHEQAWKGSADGLEAMRLARERIPGLEADLFGIHQEPVGLPPWIRYHRNPAQDRLCELYNKAAIFLAPSWTEGWPLPPAEAMMCGAAVVATSIGGHKEYCIPGRTALLSPPQDPGNLAQNLILLLQDNQLRIQIARAGNDYIRQFTWSRAADKFEATLLQHYGVN